MGQSLIIPNTFLHSSSYTLPSFVRSNPFAEDNNPGPRQIVYTTKKGDSLWSIAKKFGVKTSHIPIGTKLPRHLKPNTKIILATTEKIYSIHYKIKHGDTLAAIAHKHKTTLLKLKRLNKMHSNKIHAGQKIKIPVA